MEKSKIKITSSRSQMTSGKSTVKYLLDEEEVIDRANRHDCLHLISNLMST